MTRAQSVARAWPLRRSRRSPHFLVVTVYVQAAAQWWFLIIFLVVTVYVQGFPLKRGRFLNYGLTLGNGKRRPQ